MAEGATIATAYVQLVPTLQGVQGAIGEAFGGGEAEQAANNAGGRMGSSLLAGLKKIAGPAAIAGIAGAIFAVGSTFDDVSDSIRVATGKTGADLDTMVASAKNIGTTIPVEFDKIGPALATVSQRTGLTGKDLETVTSQFLALGQVTGKDLNIDQATAAFSAFGVKGADVSTQMDNLLKVSQATGTGIDDITGSVQKSAPALQELGFNFESSAALVGQLDKAGLNSQTVLGGMGKALVKLSKDGEAPQEAFQRVTGQIGDLVKSGDDAKAIDLASTLFGTKGAAQFVEATKSGALNVKDLTTQIDASSETVLGAQADTADFAETWTLFKNKALVAIEPVATAVFGFAGQAMQALLDAFDNLGSAVDAVTGFLSDYKDVLIPLGVVVLGLSARIIAQTIATVANTIATKAIKIATEAWAVAQKALNLILKDNPIGLVVAAIGLLVAGLIWAYQNVGWFRDIVDKTWHVIAEAAQWAWENVIKPVFDALSTAVAAVIDWFSHFGDNISSILSHIGGWISDAWKAILDFFISLPSRVWDLIVSAATTIASFGSSFIGWIANGIVTGAQAIWDWFTTLPGNVWNALLVAQAWLHDRGVEFLIWIYNGIVNGAQAIWDFFTALPQNIWNIFMSFETWLGDRIWEFIHWFSNGIVNGAQAIWDFFLALPGNIWNIFLGFEGWLGDRIWEFIHWFSNGISNGAQDIWNWFTALPGEIWNKISDGKDVLVAHIWEFMGWISTAVSDGATGIWNWFKALPDAIWGIVVSLIDEFKHIGGVIVGFIADGISNAGNVIMKAIADSFTKITIDPDGTMHSPLGYTIDLTPQGGAGGGVLPGYAPGQDTVLTALSPGEGVLVPEAVRELGADWVYDINRQARAGRSVGNRILGNRFAAGGVLGIGESIASLLKPGNATGWIKDLFALMFGSLGSSAAGALGVPAPVNYTASAGVEQWRGLALQALAATGEDASNVGALLHQMTTESGGNPTIVNTWDINAQRGTPSIGLMQVILPTFIHALSGTPFANLISRGLTDPYANIVASILYARNAYGSLQNAYRGVAYDEGGWLMPQSTPMNLLAQPEPVLSPDQWRIADEAIGQAVTRRGGPMVAMHVVQQPGQQPADLARELDRLLMFTGAYAG